MKSFLFIVRLIDLDTSALFAVSLQDRGEKPLVTSKPEKCGDHERPFAQSDNEYKIVDQLDCHGF